MEFIHDILSNLAMKISLEQQKNVFITMKRNNREHLYNKISYGAKILTLFFVIGVNSL